MLEADTKKLLAAESFEEFTQAKGRFKQKGAGAYTLCSRCNNQTGSAYGPAYVDWVRAGMDRLKSAAWRRVVPVSANIYPLRVIKQIASMFASACGPELFAGNPSLRRLVLDRECREFPTDHHLYCYMMHPNSYATRSTGVTAIGTFSRGEVQVVAEFAFPPFGYVYQFSGPKIDQELVEITDFLRFDFEDRQELTIYTPVREVNSIFPADFRSMKSLAAAFEHNRDVNAPL